jgi:outer membrane protein
MKNVIKIALVVAGLSLSGSVVHAQKLGYINSAELLQAMPEMKAADATLGAYEKTLQTTLESMSTEREKKIAAYTDLAKTRSEANKDAIDKQLQTMGNEIQDLEKRISDQDQKSQQDYKTKQDEIFNPILKKATDAVNAVAKEKGYAAVFDISQPSIVYYDGLENLLDAVKAKLGITASSTPAATKAPATGAKSPAIR